MADMLAAAPDMGPLGAYFTRCFGGFDFSDIILTPPTRTLSSPNDAQITDPGPLLGKFLTTNHVRAIAVRVKKHLCLVCVVPGHNDAMQHPSSKKVKASDSECVPRHEHDYRVTGSHALKQDIDSLALHS